MLSTIKRGTTPTIPVKVGISDMSQIASIDFLFKQELCEKNNQKVLKTYPGPDVTYENDIFLVSFSEEDTRVFDPSSVMYLDVRPTTINGKILATKIVPLNVYVTLYQEGETE